MRVGAVLPLSGSEGTREEWGTRHLAAIGLTEQCDADILVVSEERGVVSHARNGEMAEIAPLEADRLAHVLESIRQPSGGEVSTSRRGVRSAAIWLAAVVLALVAVPTVHWLNGSLYGGRTTLMVDVPIYLTNVPENFYLETNESLRAKVYLNAPRNAEASTSVTPSNITVDLKGKPSGLSEVRFTSSMISELPAGWEIQSYVPDRIHINLAPTHVAQLPVSPLFIGLPPGLKVASWKGVPASVQVRIKESVSALGKTVPTLPIDLSGIKKPGEYAFTIGIDLPPGVQTLRAAPATTRVTVEVER